MEKLDVKAAAQLSGMSEAWWRKKIFEKEVAYYKVGRRVLVDRDDISKLLDKCRVEPKH
jgi:excisionase family DNA binding protein